jgi:4-hydroxy-tetrahydrodipicolinate synthase
MQGARVNNEVPSRITGLFPAPCIPFNSDLSIAEEEFSAHIADMGAQHGVGGVAVNGHAGEIASLTDAEQLRVVELARAALPPEKLVIAGVDASIPAAMVRTIRNTHAAGADAVLVLPPFDSMARRILSRQPAAVTGFFAELASADVPMVVFQYPVTTGCSYPTEVLAEIASIDQVVAVKNAVWNSEFYAEQFEAVQGRAKVLAACDAPELLTMMFTGCDGLLLGASSVATDLWATFVTDVLAGRHDEARNVFVPRLMPLLDAFFGTTRPRSATFTALTKEAQRQLGVFANSLMRSPEVSPDATDRAVIEKAIERAGLRGRAVTTR